MFEGCPKCRRGEFASNLNLEYDLAPLRGLTRRALEEWTGPGIWRFAPLLPVEREDCRVTLGEGNTPLLICPRLSRDAGVELWVKDESRNPTWSYKDRLACVATSKALELGAKVTTMASTGNHGAATAAYAARAGLDCVIFTLPTVPQAMVSLMLSYGAKVVATTFYGRWELMAHCVREYGWYPMGNYLMALPTGNPFGLDGYKTLAFEICIQRHWDVPDAVFVPVGYGEGFRGIWRGFCDMRDLGLIEKVPAMVAVEPEGGPICNALKKGATIPERVPAKQSVAFSINGDYTSVGSMVTIRESGGSGVEVTDAEIMSAQALLGLEGFYPEPSSAASVAGALKLAREGRLRDVRSVVCILTSTGLKDPAATAAVRPGPPAIEPRVSELMRALKETYGFDPGA
jgi:threonine synthase